MVSCKSTLALTALLCSFLIDTGLAVDSLDYVMNELGQDFAEAIYNVNYADDPYSRRIKSLLYEVRQLAYSMSVFRDVTLRLREGEIKEDMQLVNTKWVEAARNVRHFADESGNNKPPMEIQELKKKTNDSLTSFVEETRKLTNTLKGYPDEEYLEDSRATVEDVAPRVEKIYKDFQNLEVEDEPAASRR